jgi:hypothetical protein
MVFFPLTGTFRDMEIRSTGSWGQKGTGTRIPDLGFRIPDPDPQHCNPVRPLFIFLSVYGVARGAGGAAGPGQRDPARVAPPGRDRGQVALLGILLHHHHLHPRIHCHPPLQQAGKVFLILPRTLRAKWRGVPVHTATKNPLMYSFSGNSAASAPIPTFMCL